MISFFKKKLSPSAIEKLIEICDACILHLQSSSDSDCSELKVSEIINRIQKIKGIIAKGKLPSQFALNYLFMPTGPLQETAIQNGWSDEYLSLASKLDSFLQKV